MSHWIKERSNKISDLLFVANEVTETHAHRTLPRLELGLCLDVVASKKALLPSSECLIRIMPAVANEKLGQEDWILVLRDCLAVLVEEGVSSGLDVLLVLGVIICPLFALDPLDFFVLLDLPGRLVFLLGIFEMKKEKHKETI